MISWAALGIGVLALWIGIWNRSDMNRMALLQRDMAKLGLGLAQKTAGRFKGRQQP